MSIILKKPISVLDRNVDIDAKAFTKTVLKLFAKSISLKWDEVFEDSPDVLDALGLVQSDEELAYILVTTSFLEAISKLAHNNGFIDEDYEKSIEIVDFLINEKINEGKLILDAVLMDSSTFFKSALLKELKDILEKYLLNSSVNENIILSLIGRFPSYFIAALNKNWTKDSRYIVLLNVLEKETPFSKLNQKELKWNEYYGYLHEQIDLPVFSECFSLKQIYIPLRATTRSPISYSVDSESNHQNIVNLEEDVIAWIFNDDIRDTIRLINGGPGSGKSSFLKIISTKIAEERRCKVIFVPLHIISLEKCLDDSINHYLFTTAGISFNDLLDLREKVILIFDGLDELASQGDFGESAARAFSMELQRTLRLHNSKELKFKAIVSGRDIVIQEERKYLKVEGYEILPYLVENNKSNDPHKLLSVDQRDIWWEKYGNLKKINIEDTLEKIKSENLKEITAQPLLNYLVAILLEVDGVELSEKTTINQIYEYLLKEVYRRGWEQHETYGPIQSIRYEDFLLILQEISYTAWKNNGRTTSIKGIVEQCKYMNINNILDDFTKGLKTDEKSSLTRLLTAFYFKSNESLESVLDQTFEFTHKSFSDYLISLKTIKYLNNLSEDFQLSKDTNGGRGKNLLEIAEGIITYFKDGKLKDGNILEFIRNQFPCEKDFSTLKSMLLDVVKFISSDNDFKALSSSGNINKMNRDFDRVYSNVLEVLNIFFTIDGIKLNVDSPIVFSFIQKKIMQINGLDNNFISIFVVNSQLDRCLQFNSDLEYSVDLLGEFNNFGFLSFFENYFNCSVSYNGLKSDNSYIFSHNIYRNTSIVARNSDLTFIGCFFLGSNFSNVSKIDFHDTVLINTVFEDCEKLYIPEDIILKNVKVNGVLLDSLQKSDFEKFGVIIKNDINTDVEIS